MRFKGTVSALKELSVWGMTEGRQVAAVKTHPYDGSMEEGA